MDLPRNTTHSTSVRALLTGGSPLPSALAVNFEKTVGIPVRNTLGMTECAGVISIEPFLAERVPGSCGIRIPFTEVAVADQAGNAVAGGESGVLRLRGPNVSPGYTDPRRDAGTFEQGWLISGDIARIESDGRIFVTGRTKDVIIRNAHNIDPQMIEDVLLRFPGVQLAAAVGEPDDYAGELPVAFVVARPGQSVDVDALMEFLRDEISERPAMPKRVDVLESMPQTAVGKIYKPALRARCIERNVRDRLAAANLSKRVEAQVIDEPAGLKVTFHLRGEVDEPEVSQSLRQMMQRLAIAWHVADDRIVD
jgi:fatty-acyl-CoA synthase